MTSLFGNTGLVVLSALMIAAVALLIWTLYRLEIRARDRERRDLNEFQKFSKKFRDSVPSSNGN